MSTSIANAVDAITFLVHGADKASADQLAIRAAGILASRPVDADWTLRDLVLAYAADNSEGFPDELLQAVVAAQDAAELANGPVEPFVASITDPYSKTFKTKHGERVSIIPAMVNLQGGEWAHSGKWVSVNVLRLAYKYAGQIQPMLDEADKKTADFKRKNVVAS